MSMRALTHFASLAIGEQLCHWLIRPRHDIRTISVTLNGYEAQLERELILPDGMTLQKWSTPYPWYSGQRITAMIVFEE